jgi:hypothetical protein
MAKDVMNLRVARYIEQVERRPTAGRHILAQYDDEPIIVYQAYMPSIGQFAIEYGWFCDYFKYHRMSWIKPNFLWMMYRSSWGTAQRQETVLALRLRRHFFDSLLAKAVPSSFHPDLFADEEAWKRAVQSSDVRLQWDPDHTPAGERCQRRALQLGLRGQALEDYGKREIVEVIDMTDFVASQRQHAASWQEGRLLTPEERVYVPVDPTVAKAVGLSA